MILMTLIKSIGQRSSDGHRNLLNSIATEQPKAGLSNWRPVGRIQPRGELIRPAKQS